jgi:pyrroloquinoline quinone biosynthesis protein A
MTEIKAVLSNDLDYKLNFINLRRNTMWTTPSATEMRFGFEVTMYVMNK